MAVFALQDAGPILAQFRACSLHEGGKSDGNQLRQKRARGGEGLLTQRQHHVGIGTSSAGQEDQLTNGSKGSMGSRSPS